MLDWVWTHSSGRFYLGDVVWTEGSNYQLVKVLAFELPEEITFFMLQKEMIKSKWDLI